MQTRGPRERGVALVAGALWIAAILAMAGIAIEVGRLTTTATEVQVAADAGALAAAVALGKNQTPSQAQAAGTSTATANFADGRAVDPSSVQIDVGHYDPAPSANPHFSTACTPGGSSDSCNAARATVTVSGVNYIMASILNGQLATTVTKTAVAAAECPGSGYANLPAAVCSQALQSIPQDETCGAVSGPFVMNPNAANNMCWTVFDPSISANANAFQSFFPPQCGGTRQFELFAQEALPLQNGVDTIVWKALQCCVACQNFHDFTLPVIDCSGMTSCNTSPPLLSFTTIHIANPTDVDPVANKTNCNSFSWGCSQTFNNSQTGQITASQICKSDVPGKPSTSGCTNQATTVVVLGQLP